MPWIIPEHKKTEVDRAGRILINKSSTIDDQEIALNVINNWRASHNFPLNTFQMGLRQKAENIDSENLVSQRIKRLSSIKQKLQRFQTMHLSQMQDIGGCRAVVRSLTNYKNSNMKHKLLRIDDYIANPKLSGYRSVHLIYRYYSDRKVTYNDLQIEVQLRSQLQHAWATAVETVGTFLKQALKSSQGHEQWLKFFILMGSFIAFKEKTPLIPNTPTNSNDLIKELRQSANHLDVIKRLRAYGVALRTMEQDVDKISHYYLLALNTDENQLTIKAYSFAELAQATRDYLNTEREFSKIPAADTVLVSVESLATLKKAYPNYFLDTNLFANVVKTAIS